MLHASDAGILRDPPVQFQKGNQPREAPYKRCASKTYGAEGPRMYFVLWCNEDLRPSRLYAGFSAAASSQMLRSRVSGIRNRLSTKQTAGTAIG